MVNQEVMVILEVRDPRGKRVILEDEVFLEEW